MGTSIQKSKGRLQDHYKSIHVRDGASEDIKSSRKAFYALRKRGKLVAARSSNSGEGKQVATSSQVVKKIDSDTSKPVAGIEDLLKTKKQVTGGGKKDVQSGPAILPVAKAISNNRKRNSPLKKKHMSKNKEHVQGDTGTSVLSCATESRGSKGVSQPVEKTNITKDSRSSKTSKFIPVREKSLSAVDNPGLMHQQSKVKTVGKSKRRREPKKNVTVKN